MVYLPKKSILVLLLVLVIVLAFGSSLLSRRSPNPFFHKIDQFNQGQKSEKYQGVVTLIDGEIYTLESQSFPKEEVKFSLSPEAKGTGENGSIFTTLDKLKKEIVVGKRLVVTHTNGLIPKEGESLTVNRVFIYQ